MPVKYERHDSIALITINRPEAKNALNDQVRESLYEALSRAAGDGAVRGVMITGKEVFSAESKHPQSLGAPCRLCLPPATCAPRSPSRRVPKPVMVVIGGYAIGGAASCPGTATSASPRRTPCLASRRSAWASSAAAGPSAWPACGHGACEGSDLFQPADRGGRGAAHRAGERSCRRGALLAAEEKMRSYIRHGRGTSAAKLAINTGMNVDRQSGDVLKTSVSRSFATADQKEGCAPSWKNGSRSSRRVGSHAASKRGALQVMKNDWHLSLKASATSATLYKS